MEVSAFTLFHDRTMCVVHPANRYSGFHVCFHVCCSPYSGQNCCLYTDRFYTSVALCEHLLGVDTLLCGTAQTHRKKFPKDLVRKEMDRGSSDMRFNGKCAATVWCDKRPIYLVTSTHVDAPQQTVMRYDAC